MEGFSIHSNLFTTTNVSTCVTENYLFTQSKGGIYGKERFEIRQAV